VSGGIFPPRAHGPALRDPARPPLRTSLRLLRLPIPRSTFGRNVLTLASGTALAQAIPVFASPVLTRLFDPAAFGVLAVYLAVVTIGAVAVTGRYELAVLIPREDEEARDLLAVAVALSVGLSLLAASVLLLLYWPLAGRLPLPPVPRWALVVPFGILLTAVFQSLGYWLNRRARYRPLVTSRVSQSGAMFGTQLTGGALGAASGALVGGHVTGQLVGIAVLVRNAFRLDGQLLRAVSWTSMKRAAFVHRRFPFFIVPGHVANATSSQLPTILLASFFGPAVAGLYSLAERVLVLPTSLIGSSIGDVYRQEAAETYHRLGNCRELYLRTLKRLAMIAVVPCGIVIAAGPWLFAFAFGAEWRDAGAIASILAAMVFFQIISSPLSQTVLLANMHKLELAWQAARVAVAFGSIYAGFAIFHDYLVGVALYAAGFALLHLTHSVMQYLAASGYAPLTANTA